MMMLISTKVSDHYLPSHAVSGKRRWEKNLTKRQPQVHFFHASPHVNPSTRIQSYPDRPLEANWGYTCLIQPPSYTEILLLIHHPAINIHTSVPILLFAHLSSVQRVHLLDARLDARVLGPSKNTLHRSQQSLERVLAQARHLDVRRGHDTSCPWCIIEQCKLTKEVAFDVMPHLVLRAALVGICLTVLQQ